MNRPERRGVLDLAAALATLLPATVSAAADPDPGRPNILWITCEDTSPWLGFCGQSYARTPHLDRLAAQGVHYSKAFATAPVCSPARFCLITGIYATSMGTQRLRSDFPVPDFVRGFPTWLREAGYYCTNNVKTDYNTSAEPRIIRQSWDESSAKAHWRNRQPGQPFFAVFNLTQTHQGPTNVLPWKKFEEQVASTLSPAQRHDPANPPIPPYYPDTPVVRRTMARVYDCITAMDQQAGAILDELEKAGPAHDTIVFFCPDHGQGIPRGKRTLYDTGLQVPLVIRFPEKYRQLAPSGPGTTCDRLVSFVDFAPTVLSLVGLPIPETMQGVPFLGQAGGAPRQYVYGARDRVDEAMDLCRSVRDSRYLYIRNYMPDQSWNQPESFSDQSELRQEITRLAAEGQLDEAQLTYAGPTKPAEALYDTENDPWQLKNVADDPQYRPVLERMRTALGDWQAEHRDLGFLHERQAWQICGSRVSLWEAMRDDQVYPLPRVLETAGLIGRPGQVDQLTHRLSDPDPTVRYWAVMGLRMAGPAAATVSTDLRKALSDESASVRIEAAGVLVAFESDRDSLDLLTRAIAGDDDHAALHAARTLQRLAEKARPALPAMKAVLAGRARSGEIQQFMRWSLEAAVKRLDPGQP